MQSNVTAVEHLSVKPDGMKMNCDDAENSDAASLQFKIKKLLASKPMTKAAMVKYFKAELTKQEVEEAINEMITGNLISLEKKGGRTYHLGASDESTAKKRATTPASKETPFSGGRKKHKKRLQFNELKEDTISFLWEHLTGAAAANQSGCPAEEAPLGANELKQAHAALQNSLDTCIDKSARLRLRKLPTDVENSFHQAIAKILWGDHELAPRVRNDLVRWCATNATKIPKGQLKEPKQTLDSLSGSTPWLNYATQIPSYDVLSIYGVCELYQITLIVYNYNTDKSESAQLQKLVYQPHNSNTQVRSIGCINSKCFIVTTGKCPCRIIFRY